MTAALGTREEARATARLELRAVQRDSSKACARSALRCWRRDNERKRARGTKRRRVVQIVREIWWEKHSCKLQACMRAAAARAACMRAACAQGARGGNAAISARLADKVAEACKARWLLALCTVRFAADVLYEARACAGAAACI